MATSWKSWRWKIVTGAAIVGALASRGDCANAQIVPDRTLPNNSIVTPQGNTSVIEGGTQAGGNLFHSFEQFSVPTGGAAYFNNALDIRNIISRVTGGSVSNIDGLLRANASANLFLLNPNGIIFGPNATLNIGGSFVGSTASSLNFADGTQFSATAHPTTPLLTVNVPLGLQFGGNAGSIVNQSQATNSSGEVVGLQVPEGRTLALVGGDVRLDGGNLQAPGGRVELGGVAGSGTVGLSVDGNNLGLSFPIGVQLADVSLTNFTEVSVRAGGGGSIAINSRSLDVLAGSGVLAGIESGSGSVGSQAGDIEINAQGTINIDDSLISNNVRSFATGNGGDINIQTGSLSVTNGTQLQANTLGQGNAGSINIHALDTVKFDGVGRNGVSSEAYSRVGSESGGNGGSLNIQTGSLFVTNGARLETKTFAQGNAGSVTINARDTVKFDGVGRNGNSSQVFSDIGGNIDIQTGSLFVTNGASVNASTFGQGDAGSVTITARDTVLFDGEGSNETYSRAVSRVENGAVGNSGGINITTGSLAVTNGARLETITNGTGNAGNVTITARDTVKFDGVGRRGNRDSSGVFSNVRPYAQGNGGNIKITTESLEVNNGARLNATSDGRGYAGSMTINAHDTVSLNGVGSNDKESGVFSRMGGSAIGAGGNIHVTAGSLSATNGARLSVSTYGPGDAGIVTINVRNTSFFDGVGSNGDSSGVFSTVEEEDVGKGGDINVTTGSLSVTNGAELSASSVGNGAAGNIKVEASSIRLDNEAFLSSETTAGQGNINLHSEDLVLRRGSNITTNATGIATGGNITIDTGVLAALEDSDITANAREGSGGRVIIDAQGIFGTEFREDDTPQSDITATSELGPKFSGTVEINTPDVDPTQGLVELPVELVDASRLIATSCGAGGENEFIITGRGGLPPNPTETLSNDTVWNDLRTFPVQALTPSSSFEATNSTNSAPTQIVEATGWVINNKGEVVLIASAPNATPHSPWMAPTECHAPKTSS